MSFADVIARNPPRLVIMFARNQNGDEEFQWGVVGHIPVLSLIGSIVGLQADLCHAEWMPDTGDACALVITYDPEEKTFAHYRDDSIPTDPLVGMLEVIKAMLIGSRMAQHAGANQVRILGPDGKPV